MHHLSYLPPRRPRYRPALYISHGSLRPSKSLLIVEVNGHTVHVSAGLSAISQSNSQSNSQRNSPLQTDHAPELVAISAAKHQSPGLLPISSLELLSSPLIIKPVWFWCWFWCWFCWISISLSSLQFSWLHLQPNTSINSLMIRMVFLFP